MKYLHDFFLYMLCLSGLFGALYYLPIISDFLDKKFPIGKKISHSGIIIFLAGAGTTSTIIKLNEKFNFF